MRYIVGIDEVGRGSLAGPVTVAAVSIPRGLRIRNASLGELRDSKKLTPKRRELWCEYFLNHPQIRYTLARVYPRRIEAINISQAANVAALRAFMRMIKSYSLPLTRCAIRLDGGLYLGRKGNPSINSGRMIVKTIIRGDEKVVAIKAASIIAKVFRDRFMVRLAKKYPAYGFEIHKGYATKYHRDALKKHGPSEVHRLTFLGFIENFKHAPKFS